jgi:hypothetical protein
MNKQHIFLCYIKSSYIHKNVVLQKWGFSNLWFLKKGKEFETIPCWQMSFENYWQHQCRPVRLTVLCIRTWCMKEVDYSMCQCVCMSMWWVAINGMCLLKSHVKNMLSSYKQCCFMSIQVAHWQNAQHCHRGFQEACGKQDVPYHIIVRWVHVFQGGRESSEHKLGAVQWIAAADEVHIACVSTLLSTNWQWTCAIQLSEIGIALSTICRILTQNMKMQEMCAQRALHGPTGIHVATHGNSYSI